jgi:uncharacterized membrane protein (UPF0127 family)
LIIRNATKQIILGDRIQQADSFGLRLRGLMFRSGLAAGEGLLIQPCRSVHTHFMRFPIDLLYLDRDWRVVHLVGAISPWRFGPTITGAHAVLELPAGGADETEVGDRLAKG